MVSFTNETSWCPLSSIAVLFLHELVQLVVLITMTTRHISVTLELSTIVYNEDVCLAQGWDQKTMIGLI